MSISGGNVIVTLKVTYLHNSETMELDLLGDLLWLLLMEVHEREELNED